MGEIKKYNMFLEVITPIHIGGVDYKTKLNSNEYIYNPNAKTLILIDNQKFVDFLIQKNLFDIYLEHIEENTLKQKYKQNKKVDLFNFLKQTNIDREIKKFTKKEYKDIGISTKNSRMNDIKLFNRDSFDKPFIPGSSIKGAIENSLLVDYIINNRDKFQPEMNDIINETKKIKQNDFFDKKKMKDYKKRIGNIISKIQDKILYLIIGDKNKIKKVGLSISDTYKSENTELDFLQDIDIKLEERYKQQYIPIMREYIMPESIFYFDIAIDTDIFAKKNTLKIKSIDDIIESIKNASIYLTSQVIDTQYEEEDLILGANTGFHQKTIIHALFEHKEQRNEVVKRLIHTKFDRNMKLKDAKMKNHSDDIRSPRVLNTVKYDGNIEIAGLVKISDLEEKNARSN